MEREVIARMIEASPDREKIETTLEGLFGIRDVRQIEDPSLQVFLDDVLPKLSPATLEKGGADGE